MRGRVVRLWVQWQLLSSQQSWAERRAQKMWMNKYFKKMWCIFYYSAWWEWNKGLMESNFHDWSSSTTGNSIKNHQHRCHKLNLIISNCQRNFKNNSTVMWKKSLKLWHDDGNENNYKELQFYDNSSGSQKRIKRTVTVIKESKEQRNNCLGNLTNGGTYFSSLLLLPSWNYSSKMSS